MFFLLPERSISALTCLWRSWSAPTTITRDVPKSYRRALEKDVRRVAQYGVSCKNELDSLLGSIGYVSQLHAPEAKRLRRYLVASTQKTG